MNANLFRQLIMQLPPKWRIVGALAALVAVIYFGQSNLFDDHSQSSLDKNSTATRQTTSTANQKPRLQKAQYSTGDYDYFSLALSWSPTYCRTSGRGRNSPQCSGQRPYAFVLHGLWPQYEQGWPEHCDIGRRPWIPKDVIRSMLDIMPSRGLIIHEYKKHGTCSGLTPKAYFALSRELYNAVRIPPRYVRPQQAFQTSPREIENDFLRANPQMRANMISITCGGSGLLKEIRICFSKDGDFARCGRNENQRKLCSRDQIRVPPVRSTRRS